MKLSELVAFKNYLDKLDIHAMQRDVNQQLDTINYRINTISPNFAEQAKNIENQQLNINNSFVSYNTTVEQLKQEVKSQIEKEERHWFQESYRVFENEELGFSTLNAELLLNRRLVVPQETMDFYSARLRLYSDWRYPALIIHPGLEEFIKNMVMFDPLYLVDLHQDHLKPVLAQFNEQYQSRLRTYTIKRRGEIQNIPLLPQIPTNQFGICLVFNWFNYRPLEIIKKYLIEIYQKLRPGGSLIMTFNDCDREKAVMLVEQNSASYIPGSLLIELTTVIGYELTFKWHDNGPTTWLELKKPGELSSLRGGQTLGKILPKPIAESK